MILSKTMLCHYAECHYAVTFFYYAEFHYTECRYAECLGVDSTQKMDLNNCRKP